MIEGIAKDKRKTLGDRIREFADFVEAQPSQPIGFRLYAFLDNRSILTCAADEQLNDYYQVAGFLMKEAVTTSMKSKAEPLNAAKK